MLSGRWLLASEYLGAEGALRFVEVGKLGLAGILSRAHSFTHGCPGSKVRQEGDAFPIVLVSGLAGIAQRVLNGV